MDINCRRNEVALRDGKVEGVVRFGVLNLPDSDGEACSHMTYMTRRS